MLYTGKGDDAALVSDESKVYMNRLSSLLYAAARLAHYQAGYTEQSPTYE